MNQAFVIIGILAAIAVVVFLIKYLTRKPYWFTEPTARGWKVLKEVKPEIVEGIEFYYESGAPKIPHAAAIQGIVNCIRRVACKYPFDRSRHKIKIIVLKSEIAPEFGTPSFRVPISHTNEYFNSEWDMMKGSTKGIHYVLAAGQMLGADFQLGDMILIPSATDLTFIQNICDFEWEHCALAHYDGEEFDRTKVHGSGTGHPIIPDTCPDRLAGLVSARSNYLCMGVVK